MCVSAGARINEIVSAARPCGAVYARPLCRGDTVVGGGDCLLNKRGAIETKYRELWTYT